MENWKSYLKKDATEWLLESNPWTRYKTLTDILEYAEYSSKAKEAKTDLLKHPLIIAMAEDTLNWQPRIPTRNNDPKITYFKLQMLAQFGLKHTDLMLTETVYKATDHVIDDMFAVRGYEPEKPKKGEKYEKPDLTADVWHVAPCNSPSLTSILLELGVQDAQLNKAIEKLRDKWLDNIGWFCNYFFVNSQFKKLKIGCPIAGLKALEVFSLVPNLKSSVFSNNAFEPIQFHKDYGKSLYYFGRSKKFWTFKYPYVWYNALYLTDVLTRFEQFKKTTLVKELIQWILEAQNDEGKYKPTSMYMPYKNWDFADKKNTSPWITFLCYRILKRYFGGFKV
jgi:hypothetical protein